MTYVITAASKTTGLTVVFHIDAKSADVAARRVHRRGYSIVKMREFKP